MPKFYHSKIHHIDLRSIREWLSHDELERFSTLKAEKRQRDWLAGRWAAKAIIQEELESLGKGDIPMSQITIQSDKQSAPLILINGAPAHDLSVSISHANGTGYAGLSRIDLEGLIGVDFEHMRHIKPNLMKRALSTAELEQLEEYFPDQLDLGFFYYWTAKEAAFKCLRPYIHVYKSDLKVDLNQNKELANVSFSRDGNTHRVEAHIKLEDKLVSTYAMTPPKLITTLTQD